MRLISKSTYLRDHELMPVMLASGFVLVGGVFALYARSLDAQNSVLWAGTGLLVLILIIALFVLRKFEIIGNKYGRGRYGEEQVLNELKLLDNRFTVFHNVRIGNKADNDFVVVGPTGVFALEVKRYFRVSQKDFDRFIYQTRKETVALGGYLSSQLRKKIWVVPVLVLVELRNYVPLGEKNGVRIVTPSALLRIAAGSDRPVLDLQTTRQIVELLSKA